ncbi:MAG: site-specific integrase [Anaerohalosphaeraceae bacterium]|nr:site-specific integrase [Anaerohalosphaeraceae bacterium]
MSFPKAKAKPQPCFTISQIESLIQLADGQEKIAFALMGYAGLRVGEVEQLRREDIVKDEKQFTMIHIRRGGSNGTTKDKEDRFVPVHPQIAELLKSYRENKGVLLPAINERKLLKHIKILCAECKFENPTQYKLHSFRHHFTLQVCVPTTVLLTAKHWLGLDIVPQTSLTFTIICMMRTARTL